MRTSSTPWESSHSAAATCSAPPGPLSGYGELIHSTVTSAVNTASPSPAARAPPSTPETSSDDRRRARLSNGDSGDQGDDEYRDAVGAACRRGAPGVPGAVEEVDQPWSVGRPGPAVGSFESVACVTSAMLPTTRALPA